MKPGDHVVVSTRGTYIELTQFPGPPKNGDRIASAATGELGLVIATTSSECGPEALVMFSGFRLGWNTIACYKQLSVKNT